LVTLRIAEINKKLKNSFALLSSKNNFSIVEAFRKIVTQLGAPAGF
jgi:hypothetical protein